MYNYKDLLKYFILEFDNFEFSVVRDSIILTIETCSDILDKEETLSLLNTTYTLFPQPFIYSLFTRREKSITHVLGLPDSRHVALGRRKNCITIIFNKEVSEQMYRDGFYR